MTDVSLPRHVFWPMAYLATLAVSVIALWWSILLGGNPFVFRDVAAINAHGEAGVAFRAGEVVGVRRVVCSSAAIDVHVHPQLRSAMGLSFHLPVSLIAARKGCASLVYGFVLPSLPPGRYEFVSTARFQNNLVGRDEYAPFPPVLIEVVP